VLRRACTVGTSGQLDTGRTALCAAGHAAPGAVLGEGHLRAAIREYLVHYHEERNHQGLGGQLIVPPANLNRPGAIVCRERLGGLLCFYDREAA
jgi:hypothetical protein